MAAVVDVIKFYDKYKCSPKLSIFLKIEKSLSKLVTMFGFTRKSFSSLSPGGSRYQSYKFFKILRFYYVDIFQIFNIYKKKSRTYFVKLFGCTKKELQVSAARGQQVSMS